MNEKLKAVKWGKPKKIFTKRPLNIHSHNKYKAGVVKTIEYRSCFVLNSELIFPRKPEVGKREK